MVVHGLDQRLGNQDMQASPDGCCSDVGMRLVGGEDNGDVAGGAVVERTEIGVGISLDGVRRMAVELRIEAAAPPMASVKCLRIPGNFFPDVPTMARLPSSPRARRSK